MSLDWMRAWAPGFNNLTDAERGAIADFALLWSLFEARILGEHASASAIRQIFEGWDAEGQLDPEPYRPEVEYFRDRYFDGGAFNHHYDDLKFRRRDQQDLVQSVLKGDNNRPGALVATVFLIVYRYRNNLFHGAKWQYELAGQLNNFTHANNALMKVLEHHGRLDA